MQGLFSLCYFEGNFVFQRQTEQCGNFLSKACVHSPKIESQKLPQVKFASRAPCVNVSVNGRLSTHIFLGNKSPPPALGPALPPGAREHVPPHQGHPGVRPGGGHRGGRGGFAGRPGPCPSPEEEPPPIQRTADVSLNGGTAC